MNGLELIKAQIREDIGECEIYLHDDSSQHQDHFEKISQTIPSHLTIKVVSEVFEDMSLVARHRKINDIMQKYFNQGLHALKIIAKTKKEDQVESVQ
jgi:BolA protein